MTLKEIKDAVENVSVQHVDVKSFRYGESWESSVDGEGIDQYPKIYFELPVLGSVDVKTITYSFGLVCFIYPQEVYVTKDHFDSIDQANQILQQIVLKLEADYKKIKVLRPYNTLSTVLDTTSMLDLVRIDLQIMVPNTSCIDESKFNLNNGNQ